MKNTLIVLGLLYGQFVVAQPGPSPISVYFNLPDHYPKDVFPEQRIAYLSTYLNGELQVQGKSSVLFLTLPSLYNREMASLSINGHPSGIDIFDSVNVAVTLDGKTYHTHGKVKSTNALFVQDFSGEYTQPIIHYSDYAVRTRYPNTRPKKEALIASIERMKKNPVNKGGAYLVVLNSDQKRISDALVVCNGDTLPLSTDGLYLPNEWIRTKKRIEIYHPDYPSLVLDSCIPSIETVYLLKANEPYYVDMGVKHPLKNNNHQKIAVRFKTGLSSAVMDSCIKKICREQHYNVAYHYPDSLKVHNDMLYGGVVDLKRIILLERRIPSTIGNSYQNQFDYFKNNFPIDGIFRPVNHSTYLNNGLSVVYKESASMNTIKAIEKQFNLEDDRSPYQQRNNTKWIDYELNVFITPNYLVEQLMKNPNVLKVIIGKVEYTTFG